MTCPGRSAARARAKWCAADTDLGITRDRPSNMRKSGKPDLRGPLRSVAVPDQRCTASLALALHRIRDTGLVHQLHAGDGFQILIIDLLAVGFGNIEGIEDLEREARI